MKTVLTIAFVGLTASLLPSAATAQAFDPAEYVRSLYRFDLRREPRSGEVELWTRNILRGTSPEEVRAAFLGSDEFFKQHDKNLNRYLTAMSVHVYSRQPSLDELRFWSNRLIALGGNRVVLSLEMIRDAANRPAPPPPPPPPPPVVVVARPVLPAEPIPLATPNVEIVAQAEAAVVLLELFLAEIDRCGNARLTATLVADGRKLKASLLDIRRTGAEGAGRRELRGQLRDADQDWATFRERRHALNVAVPDLRLPALADFNDSMERLGRLIRNAD